LRAAARHHHPPRKSVSRSTLGFTLRHFQGCQGRGVKNR
jgi:hypothetical protein